VPLRGTIYFEIKRISIIFNIEMIERDSSLLRQLADPLRMTVDGDE
jgi:hypothetical protein